MTGILRAEKTTARVKMVFSGSFLTVKARGKPLQRFQGPQKKWH